MGRLCLLGGLELFVVWGCVVGGLVWVLYVWCSVCFEIVFRGYFSVCGDFFFGSCLLVLGVVSVWLGFGFVVFRLVFSLLFAFLVVFSPVLGSCSVIRLFCVLVSLGPHYFCALIVFLPLSALRVPGGCLACRLFFSFGSRCFVCFVRAGWLFGFRLVLVIFPSFIQIVTCSCVLEMLLQCRGFWFGGCLGWYVVLVWCRGACGLG